MAAVESLHYVVNVHAKALSGRVAGPVALVIQDITGPSSPMSPPAWNRRPTAAVD